MTYLSVRVEVQITNDFHQNERRRLTLHRLEDVNELRIPFNFQHSSTSNSNLDQIVISWDSLRPIRLLASASISQSKSMDDDTTRKDKKERTEYRWCVCGFVMRTLSIGWSYSVSVGTR